MKKDKEENLRIGGRDLSIWFDKEEKLWKSLVLELREGKWIEIFSIQSSGEKDVREIFKESIRAAKAIFARESGSKENAISS